MCIVRCADIDGKHWDTSTPCVSSNVHVVVHENQNPNWEEGNDVPQNIQSQ